MTPSLPGTGLVMVEAVRIRLRLGIGQGRCCNPLLTVVEHVDVDARRIPV